LSDDEQPVAKATAFSAAASATDLEDLFETALCGYLSTDKDGRITRANQTFASWIGFAADTLVGKRFSDLLPIGGKIFSETHFAPMLRIQGSFNEVALEIVDAAGRKIPVLVNAVERRDSEGRPLFIRFIIFIAAERRSYERAILEARDVAQAAVEAEREILSSLSVIARFAGEELGQPGDRRGEPAAR
jgi:phosphoserine phosphatase RsbU/P